MGTSCSLLGLPDGCQFDVRQPPGLVEQRFLGSIETEKNLEFAFRFRGDPVGVLAHRRLWAKVDIYRTVCALLEIKVLRGAAWPRHVADEGVSGAVVSRRRPVLFYRRIRGNFQAIRATAFERPALTVFCGHQVELAFPQMLGAKKGIRKRQPTRIHGIALWLCVERLDAGDEFLRRRDSPMRPFIERG